MVPWRLFHSPSIFHFFTSVTLAGPGPELKKDIAVPFVRGLFCCGVVDFLGQTHDVLLS